MDSVSTTQTRTKSKRLSGILLHPTSLPSPHGIGDLGAEAYDFVDFLSAAGQHLWQILPLTQTGYGNSPYQSYSAFAGQPLLIDLRHLIELKLLEPSDIQNCPVTNSSKVDYDAITPWKTRLLRKSYDTWCQINTPALQDDYEAFCSKNKFWLSDYALFMTCVDIHEGLNWQNWESIVKNEILETHTNDINYYKYIQFIFFKEWYALKEYANKKDIKIIGDIPIFVSLDSVDVWVNQEMFQLDANGYPISVSGVPPDYFSETGQLWGNPLYDWEIMKKDGYSWWIRRIKNQLELFDYVRIDHFRGFEAYWSTPYGEETAINGSWIPGPKEDLFIAIENALGSQLPIIAEDLGVITPGVEKLRDRFQFPGMKVLQFAFDSSGESTFLPHQFDTTNCVCYTGTHDNDTTAGWYETASQESQDKVRRYMNTDGSSVSIDFIRTCLGTIAAFAIFPLQDVLKLGKEGRMNCPGIALGNWEWRYTGNTLNDKLSSELRSMTHLFGRY